MERSLSPEGAPGWLSYSSIYITCGCILQALSSMERCKRRAEYKLMGQSDSMCGQIHSGKSKQIREAESCLFNGEHVVLKSTVCGWWCSRRAVCLCVKLCIKAAPLIKTYIFLDLFCGTWEGFFCYFECGPKTADIV